MIKQQPVQLDKEAKDPAQVEKERLLVLLLKNAVSMTSSYKQSIAHTGGLLTSSMTYAYSKGIQDTIKLLTKKDENEKSV